jgi:hypothetical protein
VQVRYAGLGVMNPRQARRVLGYPLRDRIAEENNVCGLEQALAAFDTGREGVTVDHVDPGVDVPYPLEVAPKGRSDHRDRDPRRRDRSERCAVHGGVGFRQATAAERGSFTCGAYRCDLRRPRAAGRPASGLRLSRLRLFGRLAGGRGGPAAVLRPDF